MRNSIGIIVACLFLSACSVGHYAYVQVPHWETHRYQYELPNLPDCEELCELCEGLCIRNGVPVQKTIHWESSEVQKNYSQNTGKKSVREKPKYKRRQKNQVSNQYLRPTDPRSWQK